jgi:ribosomal 50S subunit-recycling heat shock protein
MKKVKAGKTLTIRTKKTKKTVNIIAAVVANVKEDCHRTCKQLASTHGVLYGTTNKVFMARNLGLVKKSA